MNIYSRALLRKPSKHFANALSQDPTQAKPDYNKALIEHHEYAAVLKSMGLDIIICEADDNFPDGNFVEDTYLILDDKLKIELNPGTPTRAGEPMSLAPYLPNDLPLATISKTHSIDGGDILKDGNTIYVGLSKRTQQAAIDELREIATPHGYQIQAVPVPEGLHLKSGMTCLKPNYFIIQQSFEDIVKAICAMDPTMGYFIVPAEEAHAANVLLANNKILIPANCPVTKHYLLQHYAANDIHEVDTQQVRLVDGALTCGSLLFK